MPQLDRRSLGDEQKQLQQLLGSGEYEDYQKDPTIRQELETAIKRKTYGTGNPVYKEDYNLPRLQKELDTRPSPVKYMMQLQEQEKGMRPQEEAAYAKSLQGIKDPRYRESLLGQFKQTGQQQRSGLMDRAANLYGMNQQEKEKQYGRQFDLYSQDKAEADAREQSAIEYERQQLQDLVDWNRKLALMEMEGGGRSGGGGGYPRSSKEGKFYREKNAAGGYSFFDSAGNPVTPAEYALANDKDLGYALEGSSDPGDQNFLADMKKVQSEDDYYKLQNAHPHIFGVESQPQEQPQEQQNIPTRGETISRTVQGGNWGQLKGRIGSLFN